MIVIETETLAAELTRARLYRDRLASLHRRITADLEAQQMYIGILVDAERVAEALTDPAVIDARTATAEGVTTWTA